MRTWTKFNHKNSKHQSKLDKFFETPDLPKFVSSRADIKIDQFLDHPASEYYMLIDNATGDMIGGCGFFVQVDENGITYCKSPYRLFITGRGNGAYTHNRSSWENVTKDWLTRWPDIPFLATVNVGNEAMIFYEIKSMQRYCDRLPPDDPFLINQKSFYLHPKLVWEMYTWQYAFYTTNYQGFERKEKDMDPEVKAEIEKYWANGYWLGRQGRDII